MATPQKKRPRDRPRTVDEQRATLTLRLTSDERAELEAAAEEEGEPLRTWCRETLLAMAREGVEAQRRRDRRAARR